MDLTGSLIIRVTTSRANLPVSGASAAITTLGPDGKHILVALTETNESGLAGPIRLPAPSTESSGTSPGGPAPYTFYSLWVEHPGYQIAHIQDVQVFPNIESVQDVTLVPLSGSITPGGGTVSGAQPQTL